MDDVDKVCDLIHDEFKGLEHGADPHVISSEKVAGMQFKQVSFAEGYKRDDVDKFMREAASALREEYKV